MRARFLKNAKGFSAPDGGGGEDERGAYWTFEIKVEAREFLIFELATKIFETSKREEKVGENNKVDSTNVGAKSFCGGLSGGFSTRQIIIGMTPIDDTNNFEGGNFGGNIVGE